ncbi:MAG TPA: zinc ribbon domain-containing protein [Pyrinomonadaceae bacterium]|nr:zinc ribbon domain-containing protein [Pyrinomonadaceae bacterium]
MFCPNCGQRQVSNEARFCPACGFPLEVVGELVASGGRLHWRPPQQQAGPQELSPRQKGIRQGAMIMLSVLLAVPLLAIFGVALLGLPGEIVALAAVGFPVGGFLRIMYALLFEGNTPALPAAPQPSYMPPPAIPNYLGTPPQQSHTLPPRQSAPVPAPPRPQRYNTGELVEPPRASVTDHTTRLLDKQPEEPTRLLDRQPDEPPRS